MWPFILILWENTRTQQKLLYAFYHFIHQWSSVLLSEPYDPEDFSSNHKCAHLTYLIIVLDQVKKVLDFGWG